MRDNPKTFNFELPRQQKSTISIRIQQFPLVLLAAITAHKVQGMTLDGVVIDGLLDRGHQRESAYVV